MDLNNEDIISKLKFIGMINKEEKLNVKNFQIQPDNIFTKISRSFFHLDNRQNTLQFVKSTILSAFQILSSSLISQSPSDKYLCSNLLKDIILAKQGILNIIETYKADVMLVCHFNAIIQHIDGRLTDIKSKYPDLYKEHEVMN